MPLPVSLIKTVYDIANEDPEGRFSTHIKQIDYVRLASDMKRLLPLTCMYVPDPIWEGKVVYLESIAKDVLKSHIFKEMLWCDSLRNVVGKKAISLNGKEWNVTLNENNMPCFETLDELEEADRPERSCITKCDILAKNGIVHEMDNLIMFVRPETKDTSILGGNVPSSSQGFVPSPPTVFQRPVVTPVAAPANGPSASSATSSMGTTLIFGLISILLTVSFM